MFYVLCDKNCKYESMTKEQILAAIAQAVSTGEIKDVDTGFVTTIKEQNKGKGLKFWVGTQAQYNALENKADNCFYIITDDTFKADINAAIEEMQKELKTHVELSNPPMLENVEYRTTERFLGAPVYVKLLRFDTAATGEFIDTDIASAADDQGIYIVEISGHLLQSNTGATIPFPVYDVDGIAATIKVMTYEDDGRYFWHVRQTTHLAHAAQHPATVVVKYTKN